MRFWYAVAVVGLLNLAGALALLSMAGAGGRWSSVGARVMLEWLSFADALVALPVLTVACCLDRAARRKRFLFAACLWALAPAGYLVPDRVPFSLYGRGLARCS